MPATSAVEELAAILLVLRLAMPATVLFLQSYAGVLRLAMLPATFCQSCC